MPEGKAPSWKPGSEVTQAGHPSPLQPVQARVAHPVLDPPPSRHRSLVSQPWPAQAFSPELLPQDSNPPGIRGEGGWGLGATHPCPSPSSPGGLRPGHRQQLWARMPLPMTSPSKAGTSWVPHKPPGPAERGFGVCKMEPQPGRRRVSRWAVEALNLALTAAGTPTLTQQKSAASAS